MAGVPEIRFELEPVAAAYHYESGLERDELVLIADFGGGTSDFCLLRVGPEARASAQADGNRAGDILGVGGVGIAGDSFDSRIVEHCVTPHLGRGTRYRSMDGQMLPMPVWPFEYMRRWHLLSFLNTTQTRRMLTEILRTSETSEADPGADHGDRGRPWASTFTARSSTPRSCCRGSPRRSSASPCPAA